jgi:hypothetical protein
MAHAAISGLDKANKQRLSTTAITPAKDGRSFSSLYSCTSKAINLSPLEQKINLVTKDIKPLYKKMLK